MLVQRRCICATMHCNQCHRPPSPYPPTPSPHLLRRQCKVLLHVPLKRSIHARCKFDEELPYPLYSYPVPASPVRVNVSETLCPLPLALCPSALSACLPPPHLPQSSLTTATFPPRPLPPRTLPSHLFSFGRIGLKRSRLFSPKTL